MSSNIAQDTINVEEESYEQKLSYTYTSNEENRSLKVQYFTAFITSIQGMVGSIRNYNTRKDKKIQILQSFKNNLENILKDLNNTNITRVK